MRVHIITGNTVNYIKTAFVFKHAAVTAHNSINTCVFGPDPTSYSYTRFSVEVVVVVVVV